MPYNAFVGSRTGRSLPASSDAGRGKSELRRAVCRITSGTPGSSPVDGKCHRKHTASAFAGRGKGEKVRQERTAAAVMSRAWQTPHGARPNRKEVRDLGFGHVPARCVKPSGRSLEPRSDARPRGMAVQQEQSRGQNSAYRSGCRKVFFSATCKAQDFIVTPV